MSQFVSLKADCIATSVYASGKLIGINIPLTMPEITPATVDVRAAGGTVTIPIWQQIQAMETSMSKNGIDPEYLALLPPEPQDLMFNSVQEAIDPEGYSRKQHIKVFQRVVPKGIGSFDFTPGEQSDKQVNFSVLSHKVIVDGREYMNIDPLKGICKIDGKDYNEEVRSML